MEMLPGLTNYELELLAARHRANADKSLKIAGRALSELSNRASELKKGEPELLTLHLLSRKMGKSIRTLRVWIAQYELQAYDRNGNATDGVKGKALYYKLEDFTALLRRRRLA